jgi:DNA modification methylase
MDLNAMCIHQENGKDFSLYRGDACEVIKGIPDESIGFTIYSPPFCSLYIYSSSEADMGNCSSMEEFIEHYKYLIREQLRVTIPGRLCAIHVKDLPLYMNRDGAAGLIDFPGECIRAFTACGWTYHSRVTIWKCPVTERERTNNHGLLHKTIRKDSSGCRQGMADYLIVFRKNAGDTMVSDVPVHPDGCDGELELEVDEDGEATGNVQSSEKSVGLRRYVGDEQFNPLKSDFHPSPYARTGRPSEDAGGNMDAVRASITIWRRYAEPVWWDIDQTDVLNYKPGRSEEDERHICPLQMGVIERAVHLWSNEGEIVFTPFAGIGSELVGAIRQKRKAIGIELKESYFSTAIHNLRIEERKLNAPRLPGFEDL